MKILFNSKLLITLCTALLFWHSVSYSMEGSSQPPAKIRALESPEQSDLPTPAIVDQEEPMTPATAAAVGILTELTYEQHIEESAISTTTSVVQPDQNNVTAQELPRVIGNSYTCTRCKAVIVGYKNFLTHKRTHQTNLSFKCSHPGCDFAATTSGALTVHMRKHTCEKPFKCTHPGCDFATAQSGHLARHMRTHTGERPFKCSHPGCDFATTRSESLTSHMRTHTGEKPFKCSHPGCDFATAQSGHLAAHMRTHTGEKPFQCSHPGCDYAATTSGNLTYHMRTHTGEKPFQCSHEGCDYAATTSGGLTYHMRTHHQEEPMTPATTAAVTNLLELTRYTQASQATGTAHTEEAAAAIEPCDVNNDDYIQPVDKQDQFPDVGMSYICAICQSVITGYHNFLLHKLVHNPDICPHEGCGWASTSPDELREHILNSH